ncbi:Hypothetical predicted protein [Paramuricea clavata]|uniref:Uncharacterized protein n=1 Tax=Paramuricea clavata TaxID=317549 RepID=A0A7D9LMP1_PARCT|nr:Hypothetical predicted protein [Paramuricea clavata]
MLRETLTQLRSSTYNSRHPQLKREHSVSGTQQAMEGLKMYMDFYFGGELHSNEEFDEADKVKLPTGTEVQNIGGTTSCRSFGYDSWKQFYEDTVGNWPAMCPVNYCTRKAVYGAHVRVDFNPSGAWIMPICARHNHYTNKDWMPINANTIAVYVEEQHTSGYYWDYSLYSK